MTTFKAPANLKAWHISIVVYFGVFGMGWASLMVRLPEVRHLVNVTTAELGIILFVGSIGSIISVTQAGRFIARFGTRVAIMTGVTVVTLGMLAQTICIVNHLPAGYALFALIAGLGMGIGDVGINVDGSAIETASGKTALPKMHAAFSIGTFAGAGLGTLATTLNISLLGQMIFFAALNLSVPLLTAKHLPHGNGIEAKQVAGEPKREPRVAVWRSRTVIFLALGILGVTVAEGASNDWLAIALVDDFKVSPTTAGLGFATLLAAMTTIRFFGGKIADRFGKGRTLQVLAFTGVIGLLLIILSHNIYLAFVGAILWGCGVALGFPLFLSAAGEGENSARRVAFVASAGYLAFLVGPPLLGFLGHAWGVTNMFYVVAVFLVLTIVFASGAGTTKGSSSAT
jgi:MFS family permease